MRSIGHMTYMYANNQKVDTSRSIQYCHTPSRNNQSPYFLWAGVSPKIQMIRIFCIPRNQHNWKLAPTGEIGILLQFTNESAHCILKLKDKKVYISRNVNFFENSFPILENSKKYNSMISNISWNNFLKEDEVYYNCPEETVESVPINEDHPEADSVWSNQSNIEPEPPIEKEYQDHRTKTSDSNQH
ncbi:hypothetical protein O181_063132 [Austropuccinia psidii MF-1]|uniref:Retroviral polymerase SH3-like domain-containing protein n=1 Tax=Austropuccinia psidii MF-1 TaxID=1389203 RepID=A0A9Q3ENZ2_9BASI|nr:hypothetical protein [Austropuccinia psidii MF-1]